ncbi:hypothetical protein ACFE04_022571 [Oxalis oulophora]
MAKRFKLRISRVFQSCRSKDSSSLPSNPVPSFLRLTDPVNNNSITVQYLKQSSPPTHHNPSIKRHVSSAFTCGLNNKTRSTQYNSESDHTEEIFQWEKNEKFHVITKTPSPRQKLYTTENDDVFSPPPKIKKRIKRKKKIIFRVSNSSTDEDNNYYNNNNNISPARLSSFLQKWVPCSMEGKVRESFAIVKKSRDPYEDFKNSMMEMIMEKQMFDEKELEELLHCFLSLNSKYHHGLIVKAFVEIWDVLFCNNNNNINNNRRRSSSNSTCSSSDYCRISKAF